MLRMPTNMANKQNGVVPEVDHFSLDDLDESQMVPKPPKEAAALWMREHEKVTG